MSMSKKDFVMDALKTDADLRKAIYTDELKRYLELYQKVTDKCREVQSEISSNHAMPSKTTPEFIHKVITGVMGHVAQTHTSITGELRENSTRYSREYLATGDGIRIRSGYSTRSRDLNGGDIVAMFTKHAKVFEDWFTKEKPKKLADFLLVKEAFLKDYKEGFCSTYDRYSDRQEKSKFFSFITKVSKPVSIICNYSRGEGVEIKPFNVTKILVRYSIDANKFMVYLMDEGQTIIDNGANDITGDGAEEFNFSNAFRFMEARDILTDVLSIVNTAQTAMKQNTAEMKDWFDGFKTSMNKYVSILGL